MKFNPFNNIFKYSIYVAFLFLMSCTSSQQKENTDTNAGNSTTIATPTSNDNGDLNSETNISEEPAVENNDAPAEACNKFKSLNMLMDKYRSATEAMANNPDGLDYSRIASVSTAIKMNIQSFERGGSGGMSPECWDELQQIKSEFESMSISNQMKDNEPTDLDFDNVND
jgi:hypothetical protein